MGASADRVVAVRDASNADHRTLGSGYLVAKRLVLTAAHIVGSDDAPIVVTGLDGRSGTARVVWRAGDERDVALLSVDEAGWPSPSLASVSFGRMISTSETVRAAAIDFPVGRRADERTDALHYEGQLSAGAGRQLSFDHVGVRGRLSWLRLFGRSPQEAAGAAVACADDRIAACDALIGVIVEDRDAAGHTAFGVEPVWPLAYDRDFSDVFRRHSGHRPVVEPVELSGVLLPRNPLVLDSPASLLLPELGVVPFQARDAEMRRLEEWCDAEGQFSVFVVHGPGGAGKTRLARELVRWRLRDRWMCGFVDPDSSEPFPDIAAMCLRTAAAPLLLVVDYAETVDDQRLRSVIAAARAESTTQPVRLLVLTRADPSHIAAHQVELAVRRSCVLELTPLFPCAADREIAFRRCARVFARRLEQADIRHQPERMSDVDWAARADQLVDRHRDVDACEFADALTLQMTALADLLPRQGPVGDRLTVEAVLLTHESDHLYRHARSRGLDLDRDTLELVLLVGALFSAEDRQSAERLLKGLPQLSEINGDRLRRIVAWLARLYPRTHDVFLQALRPERLNDAMIVNREREIAPLVDTLTRFVSAWQLWHCKMTLERAMQTYDVALDEAMQAVTTALRRRGALEHRPPRTAVGGIGRSNGSDPYPADGVEWTGRAVLDGQAPAAMFPGQHDGSRVAMPLSPPSDEADQRDVDAWRYFYGRLIVVRSEPVDNGANGAVQGHDGSSRDAAASG
jgi:hypothetical protein